MRVSLPVKRQKTCINWIFCTQHLSIISLYIITFFRKALWVTPPHSLNLGVGHWLIFLTSLSTLTASMKAHRLTSWPNFVGVLISFIIYLSLFKIQKKTVLIQYVFWILVISWLVNDADDVYEKVGKTNLYPLFGKIWSSLCMANKRQFYIVYITTIKAFYDAETVVSQKLVSFWKKNDD